MRWCSRSIPTRCVVTMSLMHGLAFAAVNIYSAGFETPPFTNAALNGQDSWSASNTIVQKSIVRSGQLAVQISPTTPGTGSPTGSAQRVINYNAGSFTEKIVRCAIDARFDSIPSGWKWLVLSHKGAGSTTLDFQVDELGSVSLLDGIAHPTSTRISFGVWNHFELVMNFATLRYDAYVNGNLVFTGGTIPGGGTTFGTISMTMNTSSFTLGGSGYFDNLAISAVAVWTNGNSMYTAPAMKSAIVSTWFGVAWRTIQRIEKRTTKVAAANDASTSPICDAESPIPAP